MVWPDTPHPHVLNILVYPLAWLVVTLKRVARQRWTSLIKECFKDLTSLPHGTRPEWLAGCRGGRAHGSPSALLASFSWVLLASPSNLEAKWLRQLSEDREQKSLFPNSHNFSSTLCHRELLQFVLSTESKRYESTWLAWGGGGERGKGFASVLPPCHRAHRDTCFLPDSRDKAQPHHPRSLSSLGHSVVLGEGAWSVRLKSAAEGGRVTAQGDEAPGGGRLLQERIIRTGRILSDRGYKTSSSGGSEFGTPVQCWIFW